MMLKNSIFKILFCCFFIVSVYCLQVYADDLDTDNEEFVLETSTDSISDLNINSRAYVVIDRKTNCVLIGKNETQKKKMASTTKIMTAILILENGDLTDSVTVSKKAAGTGGSRLGLKVNDKISVNDLLYGLMLCSGNDAAVCLAEYLSGNVEEFAVLMNKKAQQLGLTNSHFVTPHGLDSEEHYTTAYELALLTDYALNNSKFKEIVGTKEITVNINGYPKALSNTNELLGYLNGVYGVKTGFTNGANRCLVTACKRDDMDIICVVLGADTKKFRSQDSVKLIEFAFSNFEYVDIQSIVNTEFERWKEKNLSEFFVEKGVPSSLDFEFLELEHPVVPIDKNLIPSLETRIEASFLLIAPVPKAFSVGEIKIFANDNVIATTPIVVSSAVDKKSFVYYFIDVFRCFPSFLELQF